MGLKNSQMEVLDINSNPLARSTSQAMSRNLVGLLAKMADNTALPDHRGKVATTFVRQTVDARLVIGHIIIKQIDIPDLILITSETLGITSH